MTLDKAIESLSSISTDVLTGYTDRPHINADAFAAILAAMEQASATIATLTAERDQLRDELASEQEFNGFVNAKPFDDGWIDEFIQTFVADPPDVRKTAATTLAILAAKAMREAAIAWAEARKLG